MKGLRLTRRGRLKTPELGRHGVQAACRELLELHGWLVFTTHEREAYKSSGCRGQVDLVALGPGRRVLCIECKTEDGRVDAAQVAHHAVLREYGFEVAIIRDVKELEAWL